jgi:hypothetical protein
LKGMPSEEDQVFGASQEGYGVDDPYGSEGIE